MALPTNQVSMLACRNMFVSAGLNYTEIRLTDRNMRLVTGQTSVYQNLSLKRARGACFININNPVRVVTPDITVTGYDTIGGPLQASGATAKGDFITKNTIGMYTNKIEGLDWRKHSNDTYSIMLTTFDTNGPNLYLYIGSNSYLLPHGTTGGTWSINVTAYNELESEFNNNGQVRFAICDASMF